MHVIYLFIVLYSMFFEFGLQLVTYERYNKIILNSHIICHWPANKRKRQFLYDESVLVRWTLCKKTVYFVDGPSIKTNDQMMTALIFKIFNFRVNAFRTTVGYVRRVNGHKYSRDSVTVAQNKHERERTICLRLRCDVKTKDGRDGAQVCFNARYTRFWTNKCVYIIFYGATCIYSAWAYILYVYCVCILRYYFEYPSGRVIIVFRRRPVSKTVRTIHGMGCCSRARESVKEKRVSERPRCRLAIGFIHKEPRRPVI